MATGNLSACLAITLKHEGGWADHPSDPGGATMKGVTIGTFRKYYPHATKTDLRNISDADVQRIYRDGYWSPVRGEALPFGVDLATFDYGVNSGPSRAVKELQRVVGASVDGKAGDETVTKAKLADGKKTIQALCARRRGFVQGLRTFATFGKGWMRRIADIEAKAVSMWLARGGALSADDRAELEAEGTKAKETAANQDKGAAGAAGGGAVVTGGDATMTGEINWIMIALFGLVVAGAIALIIKSRQNKERAKAYGAAAYQ